MICLVVLIVAGVIALPRLAQMGFFGATTTQSPDVEISKKQGNLGVVINLPPSLEADIDSLYSGRTATNTPTNGPQYASQDLTVYFQSAQKEITTILSRNMDSGGSVKSNGTQTGAAEWPPQV